MGQFQSPEENWITNCIVLKYWCNLKQSSTELPDNVTSIGNKCFVDLLTGLSETLIGCISLNQGSDGKQKMLKSYLIFYTMYVNKQILISSLF